MSKLNELVDEVYVLNLDRREDRLAEIQTELSAQGINFRRFPAVDGAKIPQLVSFPTLNTRELACTMSHAQMIINAHANQYKTVAIFEDDAVLAESFEKELSKAMLHVPKDWHILYLGANNLEDPEHVSGNVFRAKNSLTTHAYLVSSIAFPIIIENVSANQLSKPIDNIMALVQKQGNAYVIKPNIVYQRAGFSDIRDGYRDYDVVLKN